MTNRNTKKYQYTKQLLKIAKENGETNKSIAKKAGLSPKSVAQVTAWLKGNSLATERQMGHFIKEYAHLLMKRTEHLFYTYQSDTLITRQLLDTLSKLKISFKVSTNDNEEKNEIDLGSLNEEQKQYLADTRCFLPSKTLATLAKEIREKSLETRHPLSLEDYGLNWSFFKLRGEILFKYTIKPTKAPRQSRTAIYRVIVLKDAEYFHLITQHRGMINGLNTPLISSDEEELWWSSSDRFLNYEELVQMIDELSLKLRFGEIEHVKDSQLSASAAIALPFKVRNALIRNGYDISDVTDLSQQDNIYSETL